VRRLSKDDYDSWDHASDLDFVSNVVWRRIRSCIVNRVEYRVQPRIHIRIGNRFRDRVTYRIRVWDRVREAKSS